jgi:ABC-type bacteriocin/lantibiotic exporter with double-glycine peptidase domain
MRMQDTAANCGPASVSNALQALGIIRSQAECEVLCKTSGTDGTSTRNIIRAVQSLGCRGLPIKEKRQVVAWLMLMRWLRAGAPIILCVDDSSHWVAAIGTLGDRVLVADPADNELVLSYDTEKLMDRWSATSGFYGVIL